MKVTLRKKAVVLKRLLEGSDSHCQADRLRKKLEETRRKIELSELRKRRGVK